MNKVISFIDLDKQKKRLGNKIDNSINSVLSHGQYIMGPEVNELELKLAEYTGAKYSVTCASGTDALVLSLMAYGIGPGDIVFCPTFTFPATAEAIVILGAIPYFVDVDKDTYNISVDSLKNAILTVKQKSNYNSKAIIAVDLYGLPANYNKLHSIAKENELILIADAAQSFGAKYKDNKVGVLADITCVSFFPAKPLGCYGDGGAIFTDNINIQNKIKSLRAHGKGKNKYDIDYIGINSRLDTIQASILLTKLKEFDWEVEQRNIIASNYTRAFENKIKVPVISKNYKSVWAQYTLRHSERDKILSILKARGIPTMVYYPLPMHRQKAYNKYYNNDITLSNSEELAKEVFSLPMYPDLSKNDQEYIVMQLLDIIDI